MRCSLQHMRFQAALTLHIGASDAQNATLRVAADPLGRTRFCPLVRCGGGGGGDGDGGSGGDGGYARSCWRPDGSRPLKRCGFCCHQLVIEGAVAEVEAEAEAQAQAEAGAEVDAEADAEVELLPLSRGVRYFLAVVGFEPRTGRRHRAAPLAHAGVEDSSLATVAWRAKRGYTYLIAVSASPADDDFEPLKWGTEPASLPTLRYELALPPDAIQPATLCAGGCNPLLQPYVSRYELALRGCAPLPNAAHHRGAPCCAPAEVTAEIAAEGELPIPTGLAAMEPAERLGGGGASRTGHDLRSGNPGETNLVDLRDGSFHAPPGALLSSVGFVYRYLSGYSADTRSPGPSFELLLHDCPAGACHCTVSYLCCPHTRCDPGCNTLQSRRSE